MRTLLLSFLLLSAGVANASTPHPNVCYIDYLATIGYTTTSVIASTAGPRKCLVIQNRNAAGGSSLYVRVNAAHPTGVTDGIEIPGGATWEPNYVPSNNIYIKAFGGVVSATIMSGKLIP